MNPWRAVFILAKRSLTMLGVVVAVSVASVVGLEMLSDSIGATLQQLRASTQEMRAQLDTKQSDLLNVRSHIQRYQELRTQGLIGVPDRPLWVEQLQESYRQTGIPGNLVYQLQPPHRLSSVVPGTQAPIPDQSEPSAHDLQFSFTDGHEADLLNLIRNYRARVKARFRVNSCEMRDAKESGLTVECTLRFLTLPEVTAPN